MTEEDAKLERFVRLFRPPCPGCRARISSMSNCACPECRRELTMQSVLRSMSRRHVPLRLVVLDIVIGILLLLTVGEYLSNISNWHAHSGSACVMFAPLVLLVVGRIVASRNVTAFAQPVDLPKLADYLAEDDVPCPQCGYNLRGLKGGRCPECDHTLLVSELLQREVAKVGLSPGEAVHGTMTGVLVWAAVVVVVLGLFWMMTTWWVALALLGVLAFWRGGVKAVEWVVRRKKSGAEADVTDGRE